MDSNDSFTEAERFGVGHGTVPAQEGTSTTCYRGSSDGNGCSLYSTNSIPGTKGRTLEPPADERVELLR